MRGKSARSPCLFRPMGGPKMAPVDVPIQGRVAGLERQTVSPFSLDAPGPGKHGARIDVASA